MSLRTIMIFPEFDDMEIINKIREKYDPLADLVRPHITLVFPFESPISNNELTQILEKRLTGIKPFALKLDGISKQQDAFGNYLFMEVMQGTEEIINIHDMLYANEFAEFDMGLSYKPHMTIGKLPTSELLEEAFVDVQEMKEMKNMPKDFFCTKVEKISVEMIGESEESIIVIEKKL